VFNEQSAPTAQQSAERPKRYYVYTYRDTDGVPVYVGKGLDARSFRHLESAEWLDELDHVTVENQV
jgi:hypothetical protein